jgi:hypothetical protein
MRQTKSKSKANRKSSPLFLTQFRGAHLSADGRTASGVVSFCKADGAQSGRIDVPFTAKLELEKARKVLLGVCA